MLAYSLDFEAMSAYAHQIQHQHSAPSLLDDSGMCCQFCHSLAMN